MRLGFPCPASPIPGNVLYPGLGWECWDAAGLGSLDVGAVPKSPFPEQVPCLLELKRCPSVVFAGVDDPEEVTADTFQELFQAGGFVVSDEELLERVTLGESQGHVPKPSPWLFPGGSSCPLADI